MFRHSCFLENYISDVNISQNANVRIMNKENNMKFIKGAHTNIYLGTDFLAFSQSQLILCECIIFYSYYISTTFFGPYGPSSGGLYILVIS
jgi:hypothetical protein